MNVPIEKVILTVLLVPMGPDVDTHPRDKDCLWGLPLCIWGEPGISKSARVRQASRALNLAMEPVYAGTKQPEDFSGIPVYKDGELNIECMLGAVRNLLLFQEGVLFLDEVSCAVYATQQALLSLVQERRVGDTLLPPGVRIILAANPSEVAANGRELAAPLANRMAHIHMNPPTGHQWGRYMMRTDKTELQPLHEGMEIVRDQWDTAWPYAVSLFAGFMESKDMLHRLPPEGHEDRGRAWPSARSWDSSARCVATCMALDKGDKTINRKGGRMQVSALAMTLVEACVGEAAATEWSTWVANADLPTAEEALTTGWRPDRKRLDRTYAVLGSIGSYIRSLQMTTDKQVQMAVRAWELLGFSCDVGQSDVAMIVAEQLARMGFGGDSQHKAVCKAADPVVLRLGKSGVAIYVSRGNS